MTQERADAIPATCWLEDSVPSYEGDDVVVEAVLADVDEVALIVRSAGQPDDTPEMFLVHLDRVHAIALAGQLAAAATASQTLLPKGHA